MSGGPHPVVYLGALVVLLLGAAMLLPDNGLSGYVLKEPTCGELGCTQLCDEAAPVCADAGETCCPTRWGTGVCDLAANCEVISSYSDRMSLTQYQDTVREAPASVMQDWARVLGSIAVVMGLAVWVVLHGRSSKRILR